jgi:hypothetical protein
MRPHASGLIADQLVVRIQDGELTSPEADHAFDEHSRAQLDPRDAPPPGKDEEQAPGVVADLAPEA